MTTTACGSLTMYSLPLAVTIRKGRNGSFITNSCNESCWMAMRYPQLPLSYYSVFNKNAARIFMRTAFSVVSIAELLLGFGRSAGAAGLGGGELGVFHLEPFDA